MPRKRTGCLAAIIPLIIVVCVSLAIVGSIVTWTATREGIGLSEFATRIFGERRSARLVLAQRTPLPTATSYPWLRLVATATEAPQELIAEPASSPLPVETPMANPSSPQAMATSPPLSAAPSEPQIEPAIESPIRPGSPLPERPATRLVIPTMELDIPVTIAPIVSQSWKVDHLGQDFVGHLEGTASPGASSNIVLAGHVTIAQDVFGPFAGLGQLKPGDPIIVYESDQPYTYIVDYRQLVDRTAVNVAYPTEVGRITLITCSNWSDELGAYRERLIVVGHLEGEGS